MAERSPRDPRDPLDEEAAWAEIVAGYGEQPEFPDPDGPRDAGRAPDAAGQGTDKAVGQDPGKAADREPDGPSAEGSPADDAPGSPGTPGSPGGPSRPGSFVVFAPGVGPRDWSAAEPSDDDFDATDEGHFTPPEPPPLPSPDVTTKFAWIAVLGGPLLLVVMMLLQQPVTWWITVLGIGGFLGGFATLVARMKNDREDDDDLPGGGAVV
ncbi:hypothetical protein GCM10010211_18570 [Streptomyces albospinus]|uniref:DUF308 domain-containing protein n=1 Tax=Streptomyces albospinus TaxID=285515 RepID=A0ABQ2UU40_9ACTN|nr:hypothetical protein [Streptomyces albospinus]GGU53965.1 hypothetical protein GCM10010211_18570 [Streptomyces albospinus]